MKNPLAKNKPAHDREKLLLSLELAEIREVSDLIFGKLDQKIQVLEAVEASVDKKLAELEHILQRMDHLRTPGAANGGALRRHEIFNLSERGLKSGEIAEILGIPIGEVELILELNTHRA